jgi:hypothetical protein
MTELVTSGSVGGMASNGCLYPEVDTQQRFGAKQRQDARDAAKGNHRLQHQRHAERADLSGFG